MIQEQNNSNLKDPMNRDDLDELNDLLVTKQEESGRVAAIQTMFDKSNDSVKMKSELSRDVNEAYYYSKIFMLSDILHCPPLKNWALHNLELNISNGREARKEAVDMNRSSYPEPQRRGIFGSLFGGGRQ